MKLRLIVLLSLFILTSCDETEQPPAVQEEPALVLERAAFSDLPDWGGGDLRGFVPAFQRSCERILRAPADKVFGAFVEAGSYGDWQKICTDFEALDTTDSAGLRGFFETAFVPYRVSENGHPIGLFTGYYEASLRGSRLRKDSYLYPLHKRPDDLVMVQLGDFRDHLKGERIAGRVRDGRLVPYESREAIVAGHWPHNDDVLVWIDDAVDAFFVQIQGSGLVQMDDGSLVRIGYAGQNGHPYYAIGRELIEMGALTKESVSMQTIRAWLEENPAQADAVMNTNHSYVFFRELTEDGPLGAEGVALTPERSLAVDRTLLPYGLPLWVDIEGVRTGGAPEEDAAPIRRLMIAQDTGGAIRGAVRGDVFWGHGSKAEEMAGHMKSQGQYWAFLPADALN